MLSIFTTNVSASLHFVLDTKDGLTTTKEMARAASFMLMEIATRVIGKMMSGLDWGHLRGEMAIFSMGFGKTTGKHMLTL